MRAQDFVTEAVISLSPSSQKAQAWIQMVYDRYPQTWQNNHVMPIGPEEFAMFELTPSLSRRDAVEVKWFQAYPLRQGVGSRAMKELQALAREHDISLTLFPWDKGQVSQAKLTKFYRGQGFTPAKKGSKNMQWSPVTEAQVPPVRDQIIADYRRSGGDVNEYFVRFTDVDRLGFSARQVFARTPDADDPRYDNDYIGAGKGRRALWFYPLAAYLKDVQGFYATDKPYLWLVRKKPDAWLQPMGPDERGVKPAPAGQRRVGMLKSGNPPAAIFFEPAFDVVGRYYDYAGQHQRHGQVKGRPAPSFFDRIRGNT